MFIEYTEIASEKLLSCNLLNGIKKKLRELLEQYLFIIINGSQIRTFEVLRPACFTLISP